MDQRSGGIVTLAALLALVATAGMAASAQAANYTVGTKEDRGGTCKEPASGTCSLRELINYENELPSTPSPPDSIVVPSGKYDLTLGALTIKQSFVIIGAGARTTTVDVPATASLERVFDVQLEAKGGEGSTIGIVGLEIAGGTANEKNGSFGGDIRSIGDLVLIEDWITAGTAEFGGGISNNSGTLVVEDSLVSGNHASIGEGDSGGIQNFGAPGTTDKPGTLAILNSTITGNDARLGGGIFSSGDATNKTTLENSTIAFNRTQEETGVPASESGGGLALASNGGTAQVIGSIIADNTETLLSGGTTARNCSAQEPAKIEDPLGYNLESGTDCGFKSTGDLQGTSPGFSSTTPQNNGGNTDTLALEPTSRAVDAIPTSFPFCSGTDQRGVARPQGAGCDIGAFEFGNVVTPPPPPPPPPAPPTLLSASPPTVLTTTSAAFTTTVNPHGLATSVHFEYGPVLGGAKTTTITYGSVTPDQSAGSDFANHTVTAEVTGLLPNVTYHVRAVATNSAGSVQGADQTLVTPADPPPPPPVLGKSVNVAPVSGVVYIELPLGATLASFSPSALPSEAFAALTKGRAFVPLTEARQIPVGSILDTTAGVVGITTATTASAKGKVQSGDFGAGIFKLLQQRRQRGLTEMDIIDNHSARQAVRDAGQEGPDRGQPSEPQGPRPAHSQLARALHRTRAIQRGNRAWDDLERAEPLRRNTHTGRARCRIGSRLPPAQDDHAVHRPDLSGESTTLLRCDSTFAHGPVRACARRRSCPRCSSPWWQRPGWPRPRRRRPTRWGHSKTAPGRARIRPAAPARCGS